MEPELQSPPQMIYTKNFGDLQVVRSWVEGANHVALLANGAYVHITGLPIMDKAILRKTIPIEYLPEALDWFEHRHDEKGEQPLRVMFEADGSFTLEDGSPITSISQLTQALKPGPILDAALMWFTKTHEVAAAEAQQNKDPKRPQPKAKPKGAARKKSVQAKQAAAG